MKALVITVPDGFKTAVVTVTYEGADGKMDLETKSTRGQDTNWTLDFSDADTTEKSNKVTFEDYFRTVFPETGSDSGSPAREKGANGHNKNQARKMPGMRKRN